MNIQSTKVDELAQQLAHLTGEDIETALERAIEERLARVSAPQLNPSQQAKVEHIMALVRSVNRIEPAHQDDPTSFLYDDRGLPA